MHVDIDQLSPHLGRPCVLLDARGVVLFASPSAQRLFGASLRVGDRAPPMGGRQLPVRGDRVLVLLDALSGFRLGLLDEVDLGLLEVDASGRVTRANRPADRLLGGPAAGRLLTERVPAAEQAWLGEALRAALQGERRSGQLSLVGLTSVSTHPVTVLPPTDEDGVMVVVYPRTLGQRSASGAALMAAEVAAMIGGVSHDLNNALTVIADALGEDGHPPTAAQLSSGRAALREAAKVGHDLLALARGARGAATERTLVGPLLRGLAQGLVSSGLPMTISGPEPDGLAVAMSEASTRRICEALIEHALDQLGPGQGLRCQARAEDAGVMIVLSHNGRAPSPTEQAALFAPFGLVREGAQLGRGLSLARTLAHLHGGELSLRLDAGWTHLLLRLPGPPVVTPPVRAARRLLVVDDEPLVLRSLTRLGQRQGLVVVPAGDAASALSVLRSGEPIDVALIDLVMPDMDGEALLDAVRQLRPSVSVIMMSGYAREERAAHCLSQGAVAFLRKPFGWAELERALQSCGASASEANDDLGVG